MSAQLSSRHKRFTPRIGSKAACSTSTKPKAVVTGIIPRIHGDIIDEILDHLATDPNFHRSLRTCALISKSWVQPCRRRLFHTVDFTSETLQRWFKTFPVPEESPADHVQDLRVWIGGHNWVPDKFFQCTMWFTNLQRVFLLGRGPQEGSPPSRKPSRWKLPQSVTALTVDTDAVTLLQTRNVMAQLPNLDDLSIMGRLAPVDEGAQLWIETFLRGGFGGKLVLRAGHTSKDILNMLLEIPAGLRFTEVEIHCARECLPLVIRLVEACSKTLVRLSHMVTSYGNSRLST